MHTDLSPHLHTSHCNELIDALRKCHKDVSILPDPRCLYNRSNLIMCILFLQNKFSQFLGACNTFDNAVVKCLKQERIARSAANRARARERQELLKQRLDQQQ